MIAGGDRYTPTRATVVRLEDQIAELACDQVILGGGDAAQGFAVEQHIGRTRGARVDGLDQQVVVLAHVSDAAMRNHLVRRLGSRSGHEFAPVFAVLEFDDLQAIVVRGAEGDTID